MNRTAILTLCALPFLAACDYPDERVGSQTCTNVSPMAAAHMKGTDFDPLHCNPQSQQITTATTAEPGSVDVPN